ncbi:hypothetical protein FRC15_004252 [Serendipita sp. 397]|nr:hypothetical protein FRC15_004252 [Serendipita sp. 397]KAG8799900.1 hypothetical protein FRC16_004139 [Serendipita sp. 398]
MDQSISSYHHSLFGGGEILSVAAHNAPKSPPAPITPSSVLFSPQKSPKGPRPPPSAVSVAHEYTRGPADVEPSSLFLARSSSPTHHNEYIPFDYTRYNHDDHARNETEKLTTSLLSATSASPPPFARATRRTMSASSSASSQSGSPVYPNNQRGSPAVPTTQAPNPWVEQALLNPSQMPTATDNLSGSSESPMINRINQMEAIHSQMHRKRRSEQAVPVPTNETVATQHDGSELDHDATAPAQDLLADSTTSVYETNASNEVTSTFTSEKDERLQELDAKEHETHTNFNYPSPQLMGDSTVDSSEPSKLDDSSILYANQARLPSPIAIPTSKRGFAPPSSLTPVSSSSFKSSSSLVGPSHISHSLAESVTWEKVEGLNDEWQEVGNPREEVLAMSESEGSDDEDDLDDEAEWEACRKVGTNGTAMADSAFLPSVQRRRRVAAANPKEETGRATPTGRRMDGNGTDGLATQMGNARLGNVKAHGVDGHGTNTLASSYFMAPNPTSHGAPSSRRLTAHQEQIVAELQRARMGKGVNMGSSHQRTVAPLASDW